MNPKALRDIAWTLDHLARLTETLLEPAASMDDLNAETIDVTVRLNASGDPITPHDARKILEWVRGDEMQRDLRRWADQLEAADK